MREEIKNWWEQAKKDLEIAENSYKSKGGKNEEKNIRDS